MSGSEDADKSQEVPTEIKAEIEIKTQRDRETGEIRRNYLSIRLPDVFDPRDENNPNKLPAEFFTEIYWNDLEGTKNRLYANVNRVIYWNPKLRAEYTADLLKRVQKIWEERQKEDDKRFQESMQPSKEEAERIVKFGQEAEKIRASAWPFRELKPHLDNLIAGEETLKQLLPTFALSGLGPYQYKLLIGFVGQHGTGKTTAFMGFFKKVTKTQEIAAGSKKAHLYLRWERFQCLLISELVPELIPFLRKLSVDDKEFHYTVARNFSSQVRTVDLVAPATTVITSIVTLPKEFRPEDRSRWLILHPDDSPRQREKVAKWKLKRDQDEADVKHGKKKITDYDFSAGVLKELVQNTVIRDVDYQIFAKVISNLMLRGREQDTSVIRAIDIVKRVTSLYSMMFPRSIENNTVVPDPVDTLMILNLMRSAVSDLFGGESQFKLLIDTIDRIGIRNQGDKITFNDTKKIAARAKRHRRTVHDLLKDMSNTSFLLETKVQRESEFVLRFPIDEIRAMTEAVAVDEEVFLSELMEEGQKGLARIYPANTVTKIVDSWGNRIQQFLAERQANHATAKGLNEVRS